MSDASTINLSGIPFDFVDFYDKREDDDVINIYGSYAGVRGKYIFKSSKFTNSLKDLNWKVNEEYKYAFK